MKNWKLLKGILRIITLQTPVEYYKSIDDILLYNWWKCGNGEMNYMRLNVTSKDVINQNDYNAHQVLEDEILNRFGAATVYKNYLIAGSKLAKSQNNYVITRDRKYFNAMRHFETDVKNCLKEMEKGLTPQRVLIRLSEKLAGGRQIMEKEITVGRYLEMILEYEQAN